jgi:hypothetical protein
MNDAEGKSKKAKGKTLKGSHMIAGGKQTRVCAAPGKDEKNIPTLKGSHIQR